MQMREFDLGGSGCPISRLSLALFANVTNSKDLVQAMQDGALEPEAALLNASLVPDVFPVLAAAQKAFLAKSRDSLITRTLHSELVYNYSGSKHISESLKRCGISAAGSSLLHIAELCRPILACRALPREGNSLLSAAAARRSAVRLRRGWPLSSSRHPGSCAAPFPRLLSPGRGSFSSSSSSEAAAAAADQLEEDLSQDTVEELLVKAESIKGLMKMERRSDAEGEGVRRGSRWFPYLDAYRARTGPVTSREVVEVVEPYIMESRKERMKKVVGGRSYSICLVIEGLTDLGNVSAAFRSADALGIQSVHVISNVKSRRYRDNRHVSMGAEKWLDIEMWSSAAECFRALKSRGYRIATTHLGTGTASIYDMDWSSPTAIVIGNEQMGISKEALEISDLHCCIPMNGMVDSFNVSVAAGILMHHAVCDKVSRLGYHGDLTSAEREILLAEFFLRHRDSTADIVEQYARHRQGRPVPRI